MIRHFVPLAILFATFLVSLPSASAVSIDWVPVGNAGNAPDPSTGYGAVSYNYNIDKYDVTIGQYTEFLNAVAKDDPYGLYSTPGTNYFNEGIARSGSPGSYSYSVIGSSANLPVYEASWAEAARFANWLQNGQPTGPEGNGTTETGAYTLGGAVTNTALYAVTRNSGATVFIPSDNEWYKAAYYNPVKSSYYAYTTSSDTAPNATAPTSTPNSANYSYAARGLTAVGAYSSTTSPYGAYDMGGDVWQWNDTLFGGLYRHLRGGSWSSNVSYELQSTYFDSEYPMFENYNVGFRVASIPEPSTIALAAIGGLALLAIKRSRSL